VDARSFGTFKEARATIGPPPVETHKGWLHVAQATRTTAVGLRSVLYAFLTDLDDPTQVLYAPGGYLLAAHGDEIEGDVESGLACAGAVLRASGELLLYYGASETRLYVASTSVERLLDWVKHTPPDAGGSRAAAAQRAALVERNLKLLARRRAKPYRGLR
jgi:4-O-beta-D-mannosyl-D-glucose phosphorylase